jgi:phospholipid/cholesterol/gamma-HCH transport system permease protein
MPDHDPPRLGIAPGAADTHATIAPTGAWQVHALAQPGILAAISKGLASLDGGGEDRGGGGLAWDLGGVTALDHIGAQVLWTAWGGKRPAQLQLNPAQERVVARIEAAGEAALVPADQGSAISWALLRHQGAMLLGQFSGFVGLIGQLVLDIGRFLAQPTRGPWKELSANIYHAGFQALGITALVGLLIGVVLSYLSAQQLHTFGGDIYLVNILGMSIIRELGPLLAAILVAGRSGSSMTAQLGVMRVTEELDAMLVMGMPHGFRLIMPKVLALAIAMPLLVIWTDAMALIGGMGAAMLELNLSPRYFIQKLPDAVPLANYWIGLGKGAVFGSLIALVACHFGLRIKANTESLGQGTTTSVVTAITVVILADAVFAIVFNGVGF